MLNEQKLWDYFGKRVIVYFKDGDQLEGHCRSVIRAVDNEPEVPSIILESYRGWIEATLPEIKSIEILK